MTQKDKMTFNFLRRNVSLQDIMTKLNKDGHITVRGKDGQDFYIVSSLPRSEDDLDNRAAKIAGTILSQVLHEAQAAVSGPVGLPINVTPKSDPAADKPVAEQGNESALTTDDPEGRVIDISPIEAETEGAGDPTIDEVAPEAVSEHAPSVAHIDVTDTLFDILNEDDQPDDGQEEDLAEKAKTDFIELVRSGLTRDEAKRKISEAYPELYK